MCDDAVARVAGMELARRLTPLLKASGLLWVGPHTICLNFSKRE